ncbi:DUF5060 domain-containing protein [Blautia marasmi]|uniref:DUF5060 domain-containing protein n=1 Tax=Blautia marasmi TaxID=1917868 RepID=UPI00266C6697|nr:DUF4038 domain-containing protein [Blautia marasmi]
MRQYEMYELRFCGPKPRKSQVEVNLKAVFEIGNRKMEVKGFYAGGGVYVVRYYPEETGVCRYQISGIVEKSGEEMVEPAYTGRHGKVCAEGIHFRYADNSWFYPFGTTIYALSHQDDILIEKTFDSLEKSPFNKVRMCVFPKYYEYNRNEPPCFPFEKTDGKWDVNRPCFTFWDRLESHIKKLDDMGIQCDLILFHSYDKWGFADFTKEEALIYLDYVIRRLSAYPNIWWGLANEYDLMKYEIADWELFAHFIHQNDASGHLLSNHQIVLPWKFENEDTTHICLQTGDLNRISEQIQKYEKPLMIDECGYEGDIPMDWGNLSAFELVNRFWTVCVQGGYCTHGETFWNSTETLWWSKGGELKGESPSRIRFLKEILESLPGPLTFGFRERTKEDYDEKVMNATEEELKNPFVRLIVRLPWEQAKFLLALGREMTGCCEEKAYLKYYQRQCTRNGVLNLPDNGVYDVEVIDVWEMTRRKVLSGVNGIVEVALPGKEGIALLATKKNL